MKEGNDKLMVAYQVKEIQKDQLVKEDNEAINAEIKTKLKAKLNVQKIRKHCELREMVNEYSNFNKLLRITCHLLKFLTLTANGLKNKKGR